MCLSQLHDIFLSLHDIVLSLVTVSGSQSMFIHADNIEGQKEDYEEGDWVKFLVGKIDRRR